jgi:protein-S-isoprenylcysteine O-methyltransferase Ste14
MELFPALGLGWLNGWLLLVSFYVVFGFLLLVFPKEVVKRLYDRSGWSRAQRILNAIGKVAMFACLALIIFAPLKIGEGVFVFGMVLFVLGLVGMMAALFNYRNTPIDQPVTRGLYRVSRNPQHVMLVILLLGVCIAIGSWIAILLLAVATVFYHFRILGEENACLEQYGESYRSHMERVPRYLLFF